jgi:prepilin-type processing-associated H-X9-DG protein
MLLPALNKARGKARQIKCTSNLKQIGMALINYTNDKKEYMVPINETNALGTGIPWSGLLSYYGYLPKFNGLRESLIGSAYSKNNLDSQVLRCPEIVRRNQWTDYGMNERIAGTSIKIHKNVSNYVMLADCASSATVPHYSINTLYTTDIRYYYRVDWYRHNGMTNILFLDYHASSKKLDDYSKLKWQ